jgi:hypothetical protein
LHISYIKLRIIPELGSLDVVSDSEEAAGGNEDPVPSGNEAPDPINDREMKWRRKGERRRDRGIRYFKIVSESERQDLL